jgi:hypothetical protein
MIQKSQKSQKSAIENLLIHLIYNYIMYSTTDALVSKVKIFQLRIRSFEKILDQQKQTEGEIDPANKSKCAALVANLEQARSVLEQQTQNNKHIEKLFYSLDEIVQGFLKEEEDNNIEDDKEDEIKQDSIITSLSALETEAESLYKLPMYTIRIQDFKYLIDMARILLHLSTKKMSPHISFQLSSQLIIRLFNIITKEEEEEEMRKFDSTPSVSKNVDEKDLPFNSPSFPLPSPLFLLRLGFLHVFSWILRGRAIVAFSASTGLNEVKSATLLVSERNIDKSITLLSSLIEASRTIRTSMDDRLEKKNQHHQHCCCDKEQIDDDDDDSTLITSGITNCTKKEHGIISPEKAIEIHSVSLLQSLQQNIPSRIESLYSKVMLHTNWTILFKVISKSEPLTQIDLDMSINEIYTCAIALQDELVFISKKILMYAILSDDSDDESNAILSSSTKTKTTTSSSTTCQVSKESTRLCETVYSDILRSEGATVYSDILRSEGQYRAANAMSSLFLDKI